MEQTYSPGDVVTFSKDKLRYFSRIVAVPGDTVDMNEEGQLLINGKVQQEQIYYPTYKDSGKVSFPLTLNEGRYFVLSDMRDSCVDSRALGSIPFENIDGKLITLLRQGNF